MDLESGSKAFSHSTESRIGVLVIHGYTGAPGALLPQAKAFADAGYNVELPLLPGHGTTIDDMIKTKNKQWRDTALEYYDKLKAKCDKVFVFGLSMGGALSLFIAENRQPDGIVIVNNALYFRGLSVKLLWLLKYFKKTIPGLANDIKKADTKEPCYPLNPLKPAHEAMKLFAEVRKNLHKVTCPVIIFKSFEDHVIPVEVAETTYELIESKEKKLIYLNDSYHVATLDNDSDTIIKVSLQFIKEHI